MLNYISYCWYLPWVHPNHASSGSCFESHKLLLLIFFSCLYSWIIMCVPLQRCFSCLLLFAVRSASSSNTLESELHNHLESIRVTVQSYQQHLEEALGKLRDSNVAFLKSCRYTDFMEVLFINSDLVLGICVCCIGRTVKVVCYSSSFLFKKNTCILLNHSYHGVFITFVLIYMFQDCLAKTVLEKKITHSQLFLCLLSDYFQGAVTFLLRSWSFSASLFIKKVNKLTPLKVQSRQMWRK